MKKYVFGLGALVAPSLIGAMVVTGCGEDGDDGLPGLGDDVCGPCGTIATGDVGISGDARLDGFFEALGNISNATLTIQGDFEGNIRALAAVYNVEIDGAIDAEVVGELNAAIQADIAANVEGSLSVDYQPPRCQANVNVAVDAQAKCEVKAGCEVEVNPGQASVQCEGSCSGSCSAGCSGEFSCEIEAPSIECTGRCEGACALDAAAECSGTCRGTCNGTCSAQDGSGNCAGKCDGTCEGTCELSVAAECSGSCTGKCLVNQGTAQCTAEASCRGSCTGSCTGGCEGNFTPPSASAMCDASADCQASARAEANASLDCTPPQLKIDYAFAAGVEASAQAQFTARLSELKVRGVAIVQGAAKYQALLTGEVNGEAVFTPSPAAALRTSLQGFATPSAFAKFDIAVAKVPCVVDAVAEAGPILTRLTTGLTTNLAAQAEFVTAFTSGFNAGT